jgi:hypothetical protein
MSFRRDYRLVYFGAKAIALDQSQRVTLIEFQAIAAFFSFGRMCYLGQLLIKPRVNLR